MSLLRRLSSGDGLFGSGAVHTEMHVARPRRCLCSTEMPEKHSTEVLLDVMPIVANVILI